MPVRLEQARTSNRLSDQVAADSDPPHFGIIVACDVLGR